MAQRRGARGSQEPEGEPELLVPRSQMDQEIRDQITRGQELLEKVATLAAQLQPYATGSIQAEYEALRDEYYSWEEYNNTLLKRRFSTGEVADELRSLSWGFGAPRTEQQQLVDLGRDINDQLRKMASIRDRLHLYKSIQTPASKDGSLAPHLGEMIFIVHGHDGNMKLQVAEFIERITGKRPVILHEQADSGRTVIEKFEEHASEAGFAIILLTADDLGKAKNADDLNPRARQNVVLEFGYFMAKLGRRRVVALHEDGVELPSDIHGVLYKSLAGNWHTELARELKAAKIDVDFQKLF